MPLTTLALRRGGLALIGLLACASLVHAHGDVAPQPVNTDALPDVGEDWLAENPYRGSDRAVWLQAVDIGASAYNQNCARCHGLGGVSGGLAPDLRFLEADDYGDEWYLERFRNGYTQNGITKMPAFGDLLGQKAAWAIRTYLEARPDDGALDPFNDRLKQIRDMLIAWSTAPANDAAAGAAAGAAAVGAVRAELVEIASQIGTGSGAPVADSVAAKAARALAGTDADLKAAAETLTIGLSAAR